MERKYRSKLDSLKQDLEVIFEKLGDRIEDVLEDIDKFFDELKEKAVINDGIPDDVRREITKFYSGYEKGEKVRAINQGKKAYFDIQEKLETVEIPLEEKEAIKKNLNSMYPGNYVKQNAEVDSMINTVLTVMKNM